MHEINLNQNVLEKQKELACQIRARLKASKIKAYNVMGAIGSGKTTLIEKIVKRLEKDIHFASIAGDVAGDEDYRRLKKLGIPAVNLNTGSECHLDAHVVKHALDRLPLEEIDVLFVENVGNLVCPADFPLGTDQDMVIISVTEGDDMIRKHPKIFAQADLTLVNKIDLADIIGVNPDKIVSDFKDVNPRGKILLTDIVSGRGVEEVIQLMGLKEYFKIKL